MTRLTFLYLIFHHTLDKTLFLDTTCSVPQHELILFKKKKINTIASTKMHFTSTNSYVNSYESNKTYRP